MESQLLKEWTKEEREEAAKEATIIILLGQLEEKFGLVPGSLEDGLLKIEDPGTLKYLTKKIIKASTLQEFEDCLEKAKQQQ